MPGASIPWVTNKLIKKVVSNNKTPIRIHFGGLVRFLTGLSIRHLGIANMFFALFSSKLKIAYTLCMCSLVPQSSASQALLSVMESHQDMEIVDRIYMKIGNPELLVSAADKIIQN